MSRGEFPRLTFAKPTLDPRHLGVIPHIENKKETYMNTPAGNEPISAFLIIEQTPGRPTGPARPQTSRRRLRGEASGAMFGIGGSIALVVAIGLVRYAWLGLPGSRGKSERGRLPPLEATSPAPVATKTAAPHVQVAKPESVGPEELGQVSSEMGFDSELVERNFPLLGKAGGASSLKRRIELEPEIERRFLRLMETMDERRGLVADTAQVHLYMVSVAGRFRDRILKDVRDGGPLGQPSIRDNWREAMAAETNVRPRA